jgi:hypothetical protein
MMNKAAELRAVRIARGRVKPRLRVLLIYVSHDPELGASTVLIPCKLAYFSPTSFTEE